MRDALARAHVYAPSSCTVVLIGPTGSGKSSLAELIHQLSPRRGQPFVECTAAELDSELGADRLFGHEPGAFTDAKGRLRGAFAEAAGGSLLLDDLHLLPLHRQAALLRALSSRRYRPHGAEKDYPVQCRLMVGLRECPDALLRRGVLLEDLRWRLGRCVIRVPGLLERRDAIAPLAAHFLTLLRHEAGGRGPTSFAPDVIPVLEAGDWPGNIRDLQETLRAAMLHAQGDAVLRFEHLPDNARIPLRFSPHGDPATNARAVRWAMWRSAGCINTAAQLIGAHRNTIAEYRRRFLEAGDDEASHSCAYASVHGDDREPAVGEALALG